MKIYVILILSGLVTAGLATLCKSCWNIGTTKCCETSSIFCKESQCMTISEYCTINKKFYYTVKKTCAVPIMCGNCISVSTDNNFLLRLSGVCAKGDDSNSQLNFTKTCPDPLPPNGFMCPSCYVNGTTDGCNDGGKMVKCGGNEKECVVYRGDLELSDTTDLSMSMKGCITEGGCKLGFAAIPGTKEKRKVEMTCTPAIPV